MKTKARQWWKNQESVSLIRTSYGYMAHQQNTAANVKLHVFACKGCAHDSSSSSIWNIIYHYGYCRIKMNGKLGCARVFKTDSHSQSVSQLVNDGGGGAQNKQIRIPNANQNSANGIIHRERETPKESRTEVNTKTLNWRKTLESSTPPSPPSPPPIST